MTLELAGYQILSLIYESVNSLVFRGLQNRDNRPVIVKFLKQDYPTPERLCQYRQEYEFARHLNHPGIIQAYRLEKYERTLAIVFEDFGGDSLKNLTQQHPLDYREFLPLAILITQSLAAVHAANIIHKDINPSNIVFNPQTQQLKLIDFGISTVLSRETPRLKNPELLEGTLAYMSPEQTGRMNRSLDYRTDFYSLGVTFYELLTHKVPFSASDAIALVHCHLAKQAIPPHQINPEIPQALSQIVMKLLSKTAEDRYQSAWGIQADLKHCLNQLNARGIIAEFPLGMQDISDRFSMPQKLYGRETEIESLLQAFRRVSAGKSEMMLVSGYSGIGKSAIVREIYQPVTAARGYFISGKFDQYQRNIPYRGIIQAFQALIEQLLTESEKRLKSWRDRIIEAVGSNGQAIVEVIPEIELIIGKQPSLPDLQPTEAQNRFNLVLQNFIRVFAQPEHPLVLFLDDLQWADRASLQLMSLLMTATELDYVFLIGAYRDNEVSAAHPLTFTLNELTKNGAIINSIFLSPLDLPTVNQFLADTLNSATETTQPLAQLVREKTGGNPFFMKEFLSLLNRENLLWFDGSTLTCSVENRGLKGGWQWDLRQIQAQEHTENVVELMVRKIQILSEDTQQILQLAACIGNQFDLEMLAVVNEKSIRQMASALHEAVNMGLLLPFSDNETGEISFEEGEEERDRLFLTATSSHYKFVHDRIQQAAYLLIPTGQKQAVHQKIGQLLLQNTAPEEREEILFEIVNQLDFATELISAPDAREELAELNLRAGKKAKASAAYEAAFKYLQVGRELLGDRTWETHYELTLSLYVEAAEAAYVCGEFEAMERYVQGVLQQAKHLLDKVKIYEIKIQGCMAQNQPREAVKTALSVLKLLGINFPQKPTQLQIGLTLLKTKLLLAQKRIETLENLPPMRDAFHQAAMRILVSLFSAAYVSVPELLLPSICKMIDLSVKHGNAAESAFGYVCYGVILCGVVGDIEAGYTMGKLGVELADKNTAKEIQAKTLINGAMFVNFWKPPLIDTLTDFKKSYQI